jgi:dTDP-4-dehydrorhamnose 3,5-epimerase
MMIFTETTLKDAYLVEPQKYEDERGYFARVFCENEFKSLGFKLNMVQSNISLSYKKGTIRGLHYQADPHAEVKLIRCIKGSIFDVIIDLRPHSSTYKQWLGMELNSSNGQMLLIPENFAHGYQSLMDHTEVFYQVSQFYTPDAEKGIRWDDTAFNIQWPEMVHPIISEKDKSWPDFLS